MGHLALDRTVIKTRVRNKVKVRNGVDSVVLSSTYKEKVLGKRLVFSRHSLERVVCRGILQDEVANSIRRGLMYYEGEGRYVVSHEFYKIIVSEDYKTFNVLSVMYHNDFNRAITRYEKKFGVSREDALTRLKRVGSGKFRGGSDKRIVGMSVTEFVELAHEVFEGIRYVNGKLTRRGKSLLEAV